MASLDAAGVFDPTPPSMWTENTMTFDILCGCVMGLAIGCVVLLCCRSRVNRRRKQQQRSAERLTCGRYVLSRWQLRSLCCCCGQTPVAFHAAYGWLFLATWVAVIGGLAVWAVAQGFDAGGNLEMGVWLVAWCVGGAVMAVLYLLLYRCNGLKQRALESTDEPLHPDHQDSHTAPTIAPPEDDNAIGPPVDDNGKRAFDNNDATGGGGDHKNPSDMVVLTLNELEEPMKPAGRFTDDVIPGDYDPDMVVLDVAGVDRDDALAGKPMGVFDERDVMDGVENVGSPRNIGGSVRFGGNSERPVQYEGVVDANNAMSSPIPASATQSDAHAPTMTTPVSPTVHSRGLPVAAYNHITSIEQDKALPHVSETFSPSDAASPGDVALINDAVKVSSDMLYADSAHAHEQNMPDAAALSGSQSSVATQQALSPRGRAPPAQIRVAPVHIERCREPGCQCVCFRCAGDPRTAPLHCTHDDMVVDTQPSTTLDMLLDDTEAPADTANVAIDVGVDACSECSDERAAPTSSRIPLSPAAVQLFPRVLVGAELSPAVGAGRHNVNANRDANTFSFRQAQTRTEVKNARTVTRGTNNNNNNNNDNNDNSATGSDYPTHTFVMPSPTARLHGGLQKPILTGPSQDYIVNAMFPYIPPPAPSRHTHVYGSGRRNDTDTVAASSQQTRPSSRQQRVTLHYPTLEASSVTSTVASASPQAPRIPAPTWNDNDASPSQPASSPRGSGGTSPHNGGLRSSFSYEKAFSSRKFGGFRVSKSPKSSQSSSVRGRSGAGGLNLTSSSGSRFPTHRQQPLARTNVGDTRNNVLSFSYGKAIPNTHITAPPISPGVVLPESVLAVNRPPVSSLAKSAGAVPPAAPPAPPNGSEPDGVLEKDNGACWMVLFVCVMVFVWVVGVWFMLVWGLRLDVDDNTDRLATDAFRGDWYFSRWVDRQIGGQTATALRVMVIVTLWQYLVVEPVAWWVVFACGKQRDRANTYQV